MHAYAYAPFILLNQIVQRGAHRTIKIFSLAIKSITLDVIKLTAPWCEFSITISVCWCVFSPFYFLCLCPSISSGRLSLRFWIPFKRLMYIKSQFEMFDLEREKSSMMWISLIRMIFFVILNTNTIIIVIIYSVIFILQILCGAFFFSLTTKEIRSFDWKNSSQKKLSWTFSNDINYGSIACVCVCVEWDFSNTIHHLNFENLQQIISDWCYCCCCCCFCFFFATVNDNSCHIKLSHFCQIF